MALDLSGIANVGEFFSQHYLEQHLETGVKSLLDGWNDAEQGGGPKAPHKRLAALASVYFKQAWQALEDPDPRQRLECAQQFHAHLLEVLGYERSPSVVWLDDESAVPLVASVEHDRLPWLWIVEAPFARSEDDAKPFEEAVLPEQLMHAPGEQQAANDGGGRAPEVTGLRWAELLDGPLFRRDHPARWVLFLAGADAFLIDRHKWPQGKYLHFQLGTLLGKRQPAALRAVAALLHRDALLPDGGGSLLDRLDDASHKHAFAVSTDLKWGVERSIEKLGNEVIHYRRNVSKNGLFKGQVEAQELTRECITYLYRLLFLFYVEARGEELGVVPMASDTYRLGYSLESLRDLEQVPLISASAQEGYYIHESLERLFEIVQHGHPPRTRGADGQGEPESASILESGASGADDAEPIQGTFALPGLGSALFDRVRTPLLSSAKLRNSVLQEVLQNLSLSREAAGKTRGRISYAQLGINQLGAVYERLLSYTGFFAPEKLHEVRAESEVADPEARTYFVPDRKIGDYKDGEKVRDAQGRPVVHEKGKFLFKLSGRDREKNASYYTPEVLTECLTKYTLKVRLGEPLMPGEAPENDTGASPPLPADELLALTICEPAMGSGAFLNEAVNQLAHKYLEKKQAELGQTIPADQYQREWAKVKYHFVAHQVYGVDLNPLAADLGKISLWLNALVPDVPPPFLEPRIGVGNSLIGARREVFLAESLVAPGGKKKGGTSWLKAEPLRVPLGPGGFQPRPPGSVYHFLLPDEGFVAYADDKVVKQLQPEAAQALRDWRKALCQPLKPTELERLRALSDRVDVLWQEHVADRKRLLRAVRQPCVVWGQDAGREEGGKRVTWKTVAECEALYRELAEPTAAGQRLRAVMDYWCGLWFWPLLEAEHAPTRLDCLLDFEAALLGNGESGCNKAGRERARVIANVARRQRFFHWEVEFAEVFASRGGLDVLLGNPPWIRLEWKEGGVLGDLEPTLTLRKLNATELATWRRKAYEASPLAQATYTTDLESTQQTNRYFSAHQNFPLLNGVKANLYKGFLARTSSLKAERGVVGLIHQKGIYDDPNGGALRGHILPQLKIYLHFFNKWPLFPEIKDEIEYEISIFDARRVSHFVQISNLIHPQTVDECITHGGIGEVPGIKTDAGNWDLRGHASRVVLVDQDALALFCSLYDRPEVPVNRARLAVVHSRETLEVLRRFANVPRTLGGLTDGYLCTQHWNEKLQKDDKTIRQECRVPKGVKEFIVSGPHIYVATPFYGSANEDCKNGQDYAPIDLTTIHESYLPRATYLPGCTPAEYRSRTPRWHDEPITDFYRHAHREMVRPARARTLVPCIIPPGVAHIHTVLSVAFRSKALLVLYSSLCSTIPVDFFVKTTGAGHVNKSLAERLPLFAPEQLVPNLVHRTLRLNCLTNHYADLWNEVVTSAIRRDGFAKCDPRLTSWRDLTTNWRRESALRTPYERRQALVELDALAALSLGLTEEQLLLLYRVQFPVLQQYERETFYDQRGKIVFTVNKGLSGVGLSRAEWTEIKDLKAGDPVPDFAHDQGGPFVPPFDRCDREADMAEAYQHFRRLLSPGLKKPSHPPPPEQRRAASGR